MMKKQQIFILLIIFLVVSCTVKKVDYFYPGDEVYDNYNVAKGVQYYKLSLILKKRLVKRVACFRKDIIARVGTVSNVEIFDKRERLKKDCLFMNKYGEEKIMTKKICHYFTNGFEYKVVYYSGERFQKASWVRKWEIHFLHPLPKGRLVAYSDEVEKLVLYMTNYKSTNEGTIITNGKKIFYLHNLVTYSNLHYDNHGKLIGTSDNKIDMSKSPFLVAVHKR